jgi:hypothetical protein
MADLLLDYTVMDARYIHGKFRFVQGNNSTPSIDDPRDTLIDDIRAYLDGDPVLFSYMNGGDSRALLCNVSTDFTTGTSLGKYTVCVPNTSGTTVTWTMLVQDIALKDSSNNDVAGNPYGVAQVGNYLYLVDYDTTNIYQLDITAFEGASGTYTVPVAANASSFLPATAAASHGAALISLTDTSEEIPVVYLYALFTSVDASGYLASTVVRYTVDSDSRQPTADSRQPTADFNTFFR